VVARRAGISSAQCLGTVDPVVPDMGMRESNDPAGVARVGDDLLVPTEHRVEHKLPVSEAAR